MKPKTSRACGEPWRVKDSDKCPDLLRHDYDMETPRKTLTPPYTPPPELIHIINDILTSSYATDEQHLYVLRVLKAHTDLLASVKEL